MNTGKEPAAQDMEPTPAVYADAAAWIARLHGPNRSIQVEKGLRRWLTSHPTHAMAFEAMTAAWEVTGRLPQEPLPRVSRWRRKGYRDGFIRSAAAVAAVALVVAGAVVYLRHDDGITTSAGEQRTVTLDDGTRVFLNTQTRIVVRYDDRARRVELKSGEALFEVARKVDRPFVVKAANRQVTALGTAFIVREDGARMSVTLLEGKVAISSPDLQTPEEPHPSLPSNSSPRLRLPSPSIDSSSQPSPWKGEGGSESRIRIKERPGVRNNEIILSPGQRLTLAASKAPKVDSPPLESVTAWRRGLVDFENTPLGEAVEDMNRYGGVRVAVENAERSTIRVTGVFRAGDAESFAAAVARAYQLEVAESENKIILKIH